MNIDQLIQLQQAHEQRARLLRNLLFWSKGLNTPMRGILTSIVIDADGALGVYRNWFQDYTAERIMAETTAHGFEVQSLWDDLAGAPLSDTDEWIGVAAQKM